MQLICKILGHKFIVKNRKNHICKRCLIEKEHTQKVNFYDPTGKDYERKEFKFWHAEYQCEFCGFCFLTDEMIAYNADIDKKRAEQSRYKTCSKKLRVV